MKIYSSALKIQRQRRGGEIWLCCTNYGKKLRDINFFFKSFLFDWDATDSESLLSPVLPSMRPPQNQLAAVSPSFTTTDIPKEYSDDFDNCDNCESCDNCDNSDNFSQQPSFFKKEFFFVLDWLAPVQFLSQETSANPKSDHIIRGSANFSAVIDKCNAVTAWCPP